MKGEQTNIDDDSMEAEGGAGKCWYPHPLKFDAHQLMLFLSYNKCLDTAPDTRGCYSNGVVVAQGQVKAQAKHI